MKLLLVIQSVQHPWILYIQFFDPECYEWQLDNIHSNQLDSSQWHWRIKRMWTL
jgi:hypothetical protein